MFASLPDDDEVQEDDANEEANGDVQDNADEDLAPPKVGSSKPSPSKA